MAKNEKARMRVFFAELEGDNDTLQSGLAAITQAVNKTFQPTTRVIQVKQIGGTPTQDESTLFDNIDEIIEDEDSSIDVPDLEKPKRKKVASKPKSYQFVKDLNLRPEGRKSLKDFHDEKNPVGQQETVTLCVYYLKHTLELGSISDNHIYTCLKEVGFKVPNDILQVARNTASRKGWIDSSDATNLSTTTGGDNFVEHDMGKIDTTETTE